MEKTKENDILKDIINDIINSITDRRNIIIPKIINIRRRRKFSHFSFHLIEYSGKFNRDKLYKDIMIRHFMNKVEREFPAFSKKLIIDMLFNIHNRNIIIKNCKYIIIYLYYIGWKNNKIVGGICY